MGALTRKLVLLLAIAIVVAPLRAAWHGQSFGAAADGRVHLHTHDHAGTTEVHAHAHYHHHGDEDDDGSGHHDGVLDHDESGPRVHWTAPPGTRVDPPPATPAGVSVTALGAWPEKPGLLRRTRPPPHRAGHLQHLDITRTTILRL